MKVNDLFPFLYKTESRVVMEKESLLRIKDSTHGRPHTAISYYIYTATFQKIPAQCVKPSNPKTIILNMLDIMFW